MTIHLQENPHVLTWARGFSAGAGPRYLQIVGFLEQALADGLLLPGDRLPPQRELAARLGVDLTTVTRALNEARRRRLVESRGTLGTFVAAQTAELAQVVDLSMNVPPPPEGVDFNDVMRRGLTQVTLRTDASLLMTYQLGGGSASERAAGAQWLAPMLGAVEPSRVVVYPGAQSALAALVLAHSAPGDAIAAEPLIYPGMRLAAATLGRRIVTIGVDADGMRPDLLEAACRNEGVRLVYLNPTSQNPTTHTMPEARRLELARIAAAWDALIIEDDPYWLLTPDAPPPIAALAPERVAYVSTLSKCLSPGLRTAYVVMPGGPETQEAMLSALRAFSLMAAPLSMALAMQWIQDGSATELLAGIRAEAAARQAIARQWLPGSGALSPAGIHLWHALPSYWSAARFSRAALDEQLRVTPSDAFHEGPTPPNMIRISLGGAAQRTQLSMALKRLADLLARKPLDQAAAVV
ncbi:PLP-dependent aminotransferase family protein [Cupriavidus necator]|uniref:aminotransferase-like domain-containing protein n=1 Tax=Cupriavidus necator TaxID=106590 RepID=UPI003CC7F0E1